MLITEAKNENFEEIKSFLPVSTGSDFESIAPFIETAEADYIEPMLGSALYAHLLAYYANPEVSDTWIGSNQTEWTRLLKKVQRSLINLAYWIGYDVLNILADAAGFHREETENRKSLYRYQEENLKAGFRNNGFNGQDKVMAYLETNIAIFPDYKTSTYYTVRKSSLIPGTEVFDSVYFIGGSRLVFLKLQRFIDQVEDFTIQTVLGSVLYAEVKDEIVKDSPAEEITALLPYLRKPIVYLTIARGLTELGVNITDRAVFLESQESNGISHVAQKPLSDPVLLQVIRAAELAGEKYLALLKTFLAGAPETYPDYSGQTGSVFTRDNTDKPTFWA